MGFRFQKGDDKIAEYLAEYRILTVTQLAALLQKNRPALRKRLRDLKKERLVKVTNNGFGRNFGRPEELLGLSEEGVDTLREKNLIGKDVPYESVGPVSTRLNDHQLLMNWFRIHLNQVERVLPKLNFRFLAYNSPFVPREPDGRIITTDYSPIGRRTVRQIKFTPDAVIGSTYAVTQRSVLYFLEVDCGTETLSSPQRDMSDIRQKILNYQWYFQSLKYKRYEDIFDIPYLQGFHLLFLTRTTGRLAALCKLIQEMQPSNFIWATELDRIFPDGVSGKIWARGGNLQVMQGSMIGSLCCRASLAS
ncbi:MAG: replication-relaxation family protein [Planctomycetota bacterium]